MDGALSGKQFFEQSISLFDHLPDKQYEAVFFEDFMPPIPAGVSAKEESHPHLKETREELEKSIERLGEILVFQQMAEARHVAFKLQQDIQSLEAMIWHSAYVHIMVVQFSVWHKYQLLAEERMLHLIENIKCPIILMPEVVHKTSNLYFVFDADKSSAFAIKNFVGLFDTCVCDKELTVLALFPEREGLIMKERYMVDFIKMNFKNVGIQKVEQDTLLRDIQRFMRQKGGHILIGGETVMHMINDPDTYMLLVEQQVPLFLTNRLTS
jgi:hypothetical protein